MNHMLAIVENLRDIHLKQTGMEESVRWPVQRLVFLGAANQILSKSREPLVLE
jgi:hypothetical protein